MAKEASDAPLVMIAVDDRAQAEAAFDWYCTRIHNERNKLVLLTVGHKARVSEAESPKEILQSEKEDAIQKKFQAKLEKFGVKGAFRVVHHAKAGEAIVHEANNESAAFIIMGTRGRGAISRTFLGSVSDYVLHHSSCPVFICKAPSTDL